jgi:hypothetical protein
MRFQRPKPGQIRVAKWFAIFPITLHYECRWLEWVYVQQKYVERWICGNARWYDLQFVTKEDYERFKRQD